MTFDQTVLAVLAGSFAFAILFCQFVLLPLFGQIGVRDNTIKIPLDTPYFVQSQRVYPVENASGIIELPQNPDGSFG